MHVVILHGYILQGTGSNIYVSSVAKSWKEQGYAVTIVCQDPNAAELPFVDEFIGEKEPLPQKAPAVGKLRVVVPDINRLLPVYVFDKYEGYTVKTIPEMTEAEIEQHIEMTADVLRKVCLQDVRRVLANHVLLGPVIARRALDGLNVSYNVKIHGSAVEYTLVPNPALMKYALEGLQGANKIFVGTQYVKQRVEQVFSKYSAELQLKTKLQIVPPGMDSHIFQPAENFQLHQQRLLTKIKAAIVQNGKGRKSINTPPAKNASAQEFDHLLQELGQSYDQRIVDADLPQRWPQLSEYEPLIVYFGKFLPAKGVGELLMVAPQVLEAVPQGRFLFIGFGSYREHLQGMLQALTDGNFDQFVQCARAGNFVDDTDFRKWFRPLSPAESERITVTGFLDHDMLKEVLPLASMVVVPSKWPEAFGMVAVESMAAGVLPLCNDHAGLRDVLDTVTQELPQLQDIIRIDRDNFVQELPLKIEKALHYLYPNGFTNQEFRRQLGEKLREISIKNFSWNEIALKLLA